MGFNLEQYNLVNSNWDYSNADGLDPYSYANANDALNGIGTICVGGTPIYPGGTNVLLSKAKKTENREICQARKNEKKSTSTSTNTTIPSSNTQNVATQNSQLAVSSTATNVTPIKSNTALYIGIGVGVLVLTTVAIILIKRSRK
jgi:hypothetical protein